MEPVFMILIFVVFATLIIVGAIYSYKQQQARRLALSQLAAQHGWHFDPSNDHSHDSRFSQFSIFTSGKNRYAYNTTRGSLKIAGADWPVQFGDFHYQTESNNGKRTTTHTHLLSYVILESPFLGAPDLFIRGEGFFDRIASAIGFDDIDFESSEFSRTFHVQAPRKKWAFDVLHARAIEFLMASPRFHLEFERDAVLAAANDRLGPAELEAAIRVAGGLLDALPAWLVRERTMPGGTV